MLDFNHRNFPPLPSDQIRKNDRKGKAKGIFSSINDLPDELLLGILDYLPGIDLENFQLPSLLNLSRANRRFHALVIEELYATYNSFFAEPYQFLRTVISNAHLASRVRHVDFTCGKWAHRERKRYTPNAQDKKVIKEGLRALGIPDWKTWATVCNTADIELDVLHTAILMQTSQVSSITIHDDLAGSYRGSKVPKWVNLLSRANVGTSLGHMHRFENLSSLRVEVAQSSVTTLAPIFRIPSLRKLSIKGLVEDNAGDRRMEQNLQQLLPPRCNHLDELHLEHSFLQNDVLAVIVRSARRMNIFKYELVLEGVGFPPPQALGPAKLVEALASQKTSLERLSFSNGEGTEEIYPNIFDLYDGLQEFEMLEFLSCPLGTIANQQQSGVEMSLPQLLPPSLTTLHITVRERCDDVYIDQIRIWQDLATSRAIRTPLLREIHVDFEDKLAVWFDHDWSDIFELFLTNNIEFTVEQKSVYDGDWDQHWSRAHNFRAVPDDTVMSESSGEVSLYSD